MDRAEDIAKRAFEGMGKDGGDGEAKGHSMDPEEVAGRRFAEAVKGGKGKEIAAAYRDLREACESEGYGGSESDEDESGYSHERGE